MHRPRLALLLPLLAALRSFASLAHGQTTTKPIAPNPDNTVTGRIDYVALGASSRATNACAVKSNSDGSVGGVYTGTENWWVAQREVNGINAVVDRFVAYTLTGTTSNAASSAKTTATLTLPAGLSWSGGFTATPTSWTCRPPVRWSPAPLPRRSTPAVPIPFLSRTSAWHPEWPPRRRSRCPPGSPTGRRSRRMPAGGKRRASPPA